MGEAGSWVATIMAVVKGHMELKGNHLGCGQGAQGCSGAAILAVAMAIGNGKGYNELKASYLDCGKGCGELKGSHPGCGKEYNELKGSYLDWGTHGKPSILVCQP